MRKPFSNKTRIVVATRAVYKCEYCLLPDKVSFYNFQIDHIISLKHGGSNDIENLAYCCPDCNYFKGTDLGSILNNNVLVRFYNPRINVWHDCFELANGTISAKNDIGKVTEKIFRFNDVDRLIFRRELIQLGHY
jgi:5-methylcytosine-specific restriction endonuclease McrA